MHMPCTAQEANQEWLAEGMVSLAPRSQRLDHVATHLNIH